MPIARPRTRTDRPPSRLVLAQIHGFDAEGRLLVRPLHGPGRARAAWLLGSLTREACEAAMRAHDPVLVLVLPGQAPIVLGTVADRPLPAGAGAPAVPDVLQLEAARELVLRCGPGSIVLDAEGRVSIRGKDVTSRASRTNKVKGGSVQIN